MFATAPAPLSTSTRCTPAISNRHEHHDGPPVTGTRQVHPRLPPSGVSGVLAAAPWFSSWRVGTCRSPSTVAGRSGQTGRPRSSADQAADNKPAEYVGSETCQALPRGHLQRLSEESPPRGGNRQEARLRDQSLRILPRSGKQARGIDVRRRYPQSRQAQTRRSRQASASPAISINPPTSAASTAATPRTR